MKLTAPVVRVLEYTISESEHLHTADQILRGRGFSVQCTKELKKEPGLLLRNGEIIFINARLEKGDKLTVHIVERETSEGIDPIYFPKLTEWIVYEDEDLLIVNKPAGMPVHPSMNNYDNTLSNALAYYYTQQNRPFVFRCITRLDRDTSGLCVIAKHYLSAAKLSDQVRLGHTDVNAGLKRKYLAICEGDVFPESGCINAPLGRKAGSVIERMVDFENGEHAVTHYEKIRVCKFPVTLSLVSIRLETGRTHQIRIHMRHIGFPLIGDYLYHPKSTLMKRQALHSCSVELIHPITGESLSFTAPLPADMGAFFPASIFQDN